MNARYRVHAIHPEDPRFSACGLCRATRKNLADGRFLDPEVVTRRHVTCALCPAAHTRLALERRARLQSIAGRPVMVLDVDGVFNHGDYFTARAAELALLPARSSLGPPLDRACIARASRVAEAAHAVAVVSSTWRHDGLPGVAHKLRGAGFMAPIVGVTDFSPWADEDRTLAILMWLDELPARPRSLVVLDDDPITDPLRTFHVQTDPRAGGFTEERAEVAAALLARPLASVPWDGDWKPALHAQHPGAMVEA